MLPKYKLPDWFINNPYRPPHAVAGAKTPEELYLHVGMICSNWEQFEHKLMILLTVVAGFASTEQAVAAPFRAAFRSVISARGKQDIISFVINETMSEREEYADMRTLLKHIRNLTALRNKAVHATVSRCETNDLTLPWFVTPSASSKDYGQPDKPFSVNYRFNANQLVMIEKLIRRFDGIVMNVASNLASAHHVELEQQKALPGKRPAQEGKPPGVK